MNKKKKQLVKGTVAEEAIIWRSPFDLPKRCTKKPRILIVCLTNGSVYLATWYWYPNFGGRMVINGAYYQHETIACWSYLLKGPVP